MITNHFVPERDPMTITIECSNSDQSELLLEKSWTLIYSGCSVLSKSLERSSYGTTQTVATNVASFRSYRLIVHVSSSFMDLTFTRRSALPFDVLNATIQQRTFWKIY